MTTPCMTPPRTTAPRTTARNLTGCGTMARRAAARHLRRTLALVASLLAAALAPAWSPAAAQDVPAADPRQEPFVLGRRLKLEAPVLGQYEVIGIVDSLIGDIIVLDTMLPRDRRGLFDGGTVPVEQFRRIRLRVADVKNAWVSDGVRRGSATIRYALFGGLVGGAVFGLSGGPQYNPTLAQMREGAIPGFIGGAGIGALVGLYNGREIWRLVPGPYYLDSPPVGRRP